MRVFVSTVVTLFFISASACNGSSSGSTTTGNSGGTTGGASTGSVTGGTTGQSVTTGGTTTTGGASSSGSTAGSSSGTTGSGTGTGTSSAGSGSGSTSSGGTTGSGTTGATTGATTGGTVLGGPFVPYDGGPRTEPAIDYDAGCTALQPKKSGGACVQCTANTDCPTGQVCDTNTRSRYQNVCVQCATNGDCAAGQTCDTTQRAYFWEGTDTCEPDCREDAGICTPGFCERDAGVCYSNATVLVFQSVPAPIYLCGSATTTGWCQSDSDCFVDGGGGACDFGPNAVPFMYFSSPFGYCVPCNVDGGAGECPLPNEFCAIDSCAPGGNGLAQNGPGGECSFNCFIDSGVCLPNTYCADAGPIGVDGGSVGACIPGCENASNCAGATPVCDGGGFCVQCNQSTDCPDWNSGCLNWQCGACAQNSDCPGSEQCNSGGRCGCSMDTDCPMDAPTCAGGASDYSGVCSCTDSMECPAPSGPGGSVCETRAPYAIAPGGGVCITACATNADCAISFAAGGNSVCDTTTGYCVPCAADTDCTANVDSAKPFVTPSCVLYADGGNPNATPLLYTGGGQCGCSDTSQCNGGYTCLNPGYAGTCQAPCNYANGIDSCSPKKLTTAACNNSYNPPPFCNTYTGACQECLDDYDCTGTQCDQRFCDNGVCFGCHTADDCSVFPNKSCDGRNCNNTYCADLSECPSDGGYACVQGPPNGQTNCLIGCVLGDDAGLGTVSDAGNPCPAISPLCVVNPYGSDPTTGICAQCLSAGDQTYCDAGACPNSGSFSCDGVACSGTPGCY